MMNACQHRLFGKFFFQAYSLIAIFFSLWNSNLNSNIASGIQNSSMYLFVLVLINFNGTSTRLALLYAYIFTEYWRKIRQWKN